MMINDLENQETIKVLLVEDEPIIQKVHKQILQKLGCTVELAENSDEVFAKMDKPFDIIFMDMGLPVVSGADITAQIRLREGKFKHIPIIMLTGYVQAEIQATCLKKGADAVYTKPIGIEVFRLILRNYMK